MTSYQFTLGGAIVSFLGFAMFYLLCRNKKSDNSTNLVQIKRNECVKTAHDGECQPEIVGNPDIIIVGAGVAGSALAYTLGKVIFLSQLIFDSCKLVAFFLRNSSTQH